LKGQNVGRLGIFSGNIFVLFGEILRAVVAKNQAEKK
jgi:hypothetical protein